MKLDGKNKTVFILIVVILLLVLFLFDPNFSILKITSSLFTLILISPAWLIIPLSIDHAKNSSHSVWWHILKGEMFILLYGFCVMFVMDKLFFGEEGIIIMVTYQVGLVSLAINPIIQLLIHFIKKKKYKHTL